jgi:hypothetical protein
MIFTTDNSTYEIDRQNKRIRRLEGLNKPTPRQGTDGVWKEYAGITRIVIGEQVLIIWQFTENGMKGTYTGLVQQIINARN